jgi:hypothetical protein
VLIEAVAFKRGHAISPLYRDAIYFLDVDLQ